MCDALFIIVLYQFPLERCQPYQLLRQRLSSTDYQRCVYVRENSTENWFLARTYNAGLRLARLRGLRYVVLVDQDTIFSDAYLDFICGLSTPAERVFVPQMFMADRCLSPYYVSQRWGVWWDLRRDLTRGCPKDHYLSALNSGTIIPIQVCERLGGFNEDYPLDGLDHWFFYQCFRQNIAVQIVPYKLQHSFAVLSDRFVDNTRYESILSSEERLSQSMGKRTHRAYHLRLFCRGLKWLALGHRRLGWKSITRSLL